MIHWVRGPPGPDGPGYIDGAVLRTADAPQRKRLQLSGALRVGQLAQRHGATAGQRGVRGPEDRANPRARPVRAGSASRVINAATPLQAGVVEINTISA